MLVRYNNIDIISVTYLAQFGKLEFKLVGAVLSVLESLLQTFRTVVALDLLLKLADTSPMLFRLRLELVYPSIQQLNFAFLDMAQR